MDKAALARVREEAPVLLRTVGALALILAAGVAAERVAKSAAHADLRDRVRVEAEAARARLDTAIERQLGALARIEGAFAAGAAPDAESFDRLAAPRLRDAPLLRAVAAHRTSDSPGQPEILVSPADDPIAAPLAGLLAGAGPATTAHSIVLPGPPALLIAPEAGGEAARVAGALDLGELHAVATGAPAADGAPALSLALTVESPEGGRQLLIGRADALRPDPVVVDIGLPEEVGLSLVAAPRGGWHAPAPVAWLIRLVAGLAALATLARTTRTILGSRPREHAAASADAAPEEVSRRRDTAIEASRIAVWEYHADEDMLVWDARSEEHYGRTRDGRVRTYADWRDSVHPDDLARVEAALRAAIAVGERFSVDFRVRLPGGGERHLRAMGAPAHDSDGGARLAGVTLDVTAEALDRAEVEAARVAAEAASLAKSQSLATMSHELRTPMSGVLGMLELLLRSELTCEQAGRARLARDSARHLLGILNDILDLSRLEARRVELDPGPVDARDLARDVAALFASAAGERGVLLVVRVDPATPRWLECDGGRLRQVLTNLVGNALKFTDKGRVELAVGYAAAPGGGVLDVAVSDTGVGIPETDKGRLFRRFVQAEGGAGRGGAGLGLAISRQLVGLMGGEIGVDSAPGRGSTFRFWIPTRPCAAPAPAAAPSSALVAPMRVLLAEDNPTNQHILTAYLAMAGHSVRVASDGSEALAALGREPFDLVLMDLQMPGMDGLAATRRIRALPGPARAVPIVALTASAMQSDREACLAAGMTDYLAKPIAPEALHATIARVGRGQAVRCA